MTLTVDHALFAWPDHDEVLAACEAVGLAPAFGGVHDGGETQNSLVAFADGSYLELMTPTEPGTEPDRWAGLVDHWRGPENWCIRADVRTLLTRAIATGAPVDGPHPGRRERPDGTRVEWVNGSYGPPRLRGVLPFAITDRTPRDFRVPDAAVSDGPLTGIAEILVGVESVTEPVEWFRRLHDFPTPVDVATPLAADVASVPGQPVSFVEPAPGSALASRLAETAQQPLAFLLSAVDFDAAAERFALTDAEAWGDRRVAWFDADVFRARVGVLGSP
ncbi:MULTISPECIES: VOC family protein [Haloarcula]|uniref:VOC family protein n=1 Tax=Haloarcula TaxID=2237 RepID=UPI0023EC58E9|nr:VOC family protein [Halomicroarcula sp. XH51]